MPETATQETVLFEEVQRTSPGVALSGLVIVVPVLVGAGALAASRGGLREALPPLLLAFGIVAALNALILTTKLRSRVTTRGADFAYGVWGRVRLRPAEIRGVEMARFGLFSGGIGYHIGLKSIAITAATGDGVRIRRSDGKTILIGTRHPEALYGALLKLQNAAKPGF